MKSVPQYGHKESEIWLKWDDWPLDGTPCAALFRLASSSVRQDSFRCK